MKILRKLSPLLVLASLIGVRPVAAKPVPDKEAKARAALYQAQVCVELQAAHWRITTNGAGRIAATHLAGPSQPGYNPLGYLCLVVGFHPLSATDTPCDISEFFYPYGYKSGGSVRKSVGDPMPITNPMQLEDVHAMLAKARKALLTAHPKYAPPASR